LVKHHFKSLRANHLRIATNHFPATESHFVAALMTAPRVPTISVSGLNSQPFAQK
jgi:hypothetical protein